MPRMSLARQLLLLQAVVVVVTVAIAGALSLRATGEQVRDQQRERALSMAETLAASAQVRDALATGDRRHELQRLAEGIRRRTTDVGFVVLMSPDGIRYSHPDPAEIGRRYVGEIDAARRGGVVQEERTGTLGRSVRAVVPVRVDGRVVGLVAVGVLEQAISERLRDALPSLAVTLALALGVGLLLSGLLARRVRRQTRGLDPLELAALHAHHEAVLHAIREGIVVVGGAPGDERVQLVNGEARRLLGLGTGDLRGVPAATLVDDEGLRAVVAGERAEGTHVVGGRVLLSRRSSAAVGDDRLTVTTLRDRTELEGMVRELATVRGLADALRAQAHEAANELHTVVGLVEMGRYEDAVGFATRRIEATQDETDAILERVADPVFVALLLAKAATARERGVQLEIDPATDLPLGTIDGEELVTVVGNLVDNALEALRGGDGGRIVVRARRAADGRAVEIRVRDDGPGLPEDALRDALRPGWTTRTAQGAHGRGLGLALVAAVAARHGGRVALANDGGAVVDVLLPLGERPRVPAGAHDAGTGVAP